MMWGAFSYNGTTHKFNLDDPNGWPDYWHDVHKKQKLFNRQQRGGSLRM